MARLGHGIEELIEAGNPANILGRGTTGAIHEARVVKRRVGSDDILDRYGMPPVVATLAATLGLTILPGVLTIARRMIE
jgi:hypothetical protein